MPTNKDILTKWTLDREQVLRDNYARKNIKASGKFGESINHTVTDTSTQIRGNKYIGGTIYGRKANSDQSPEGLRKWAAGFSKVMGDWAVTKGMPFEAGFAIAYNIAKKGWTIPNKHGNDGRLLTDTFTTESIDQLKRDIGRLYLTETALITKKQFEKWQQT
jgi:hypothetical protein